MIQVLRGTHEIEEVVNKKIKVVDYWFEGEVDNRVAHEYSETKIKGKVTFNGVVETKKFFCIFTYQMDVTGLEYPYQLWKERYIFQMTAEQLSDSILSIHRDELNERFRQTDFCEIEIQELYGIREGA